MGISYKDAGVNIDAGNKTVSLIKKEVESTFSPQVLTGLGGFGGLFAPDLIDYQEPVFVSGTDGVGTKLKIAFMMDQHDTIGLDLVAMCVNDILAQGAKPLFFLDYLATGKLEPEKAAEIVSGIADGCRRSSCALIGGETAELPDFYKDGEYDLAGFAVGIVDRKSIITGDNIMPDDVLIGVAASGIHSNGYSMVRKVLLEVGGYSLSDKFPELDSTLGQELLKPTRIYVKPILHLLKKYQIKGIAHITGGGFLENIPRILPDGLQADIKKGNWLVPKIFKIIQQTGDIEEKEMYRTFNMGIGLVLVVSEEYQADIIESLTAMGERAYYLGNISEGNKGIEFI